MMQSHLEPTLCSRKATIYCRAGRFKTRYHPDLISLRRTRQKALENPLKALGGKDTLTHLWSVSSAAYILEFIVIHMQCIQTRPGAGDTDGEVPRDGLRFWLANLKYGLKHE